MVENEKAHSLDLDDQALAGFLKRLEDDITLRPEMLHVLVRSPELTELVRDVPVEDFDL